VNVRNTSHIYIAVTACAFTVLCLLCTNHKTMFYPLINLMKYLVSCISY